jgi:hypothetical protein
VFGDIQNEQLVKTESQHIARVFFDRRPPQLPNPKVEQPQIAEYAVDEISRKCAVRFAQRATGKQLVENRVDEAAAGAPFA